ncbi:MAG: hypothetical protein ABJC09_12580 [Terriglobia bacterium]
MPSEAEFTTSDPRPEEALLPVFSSSNHDGELEAMTIKGILEANGIPALLVGPAVLPNLEFQVQVAEHMLVRAQTIIDEARAAGSDAAGDADLAG